MTTIQPTILENDHWQVGILPQTGGSIAYARLKHQGKWADFLRPTPESSYGHAPDCSSYILIPWASRIAEGKFTFKGKTYTLRINTDDGWTIHGIGRDYPWQIATETRECVILRFDSAEHADTNFPFHFSAQVEYTLQGNSFVINTTLKNEDKHPMPGGFGHHPYFQRSLTDQPDNVQLEIPCTEYMDLSAGVPTKAPEPVPQHLNFTQLRAIGAADIDDCLTGRIGSNPIRLVYPNAEREIVFHADDLFKIIVFFAEPDKDYFAVEPLTIATDGFNLYNKNIPGSGVFVLEPGEEKTGTMYFEAR